MPRQSLVFTQLAVERMPGFRREGFTLEDLAPGVNIIFGPNGSGKTTSARAIRGLLWPDTLKAGSMVFGRVVWNGKPGIARFEAGRVQWHLDGRQADGPRLGGIQRDSYYLSLAELLQVTEGGRSFAQQIMRESVGGYDLRRAVKDLEFDRNPPGTTTLRNNLKSARTELEDIRREMETLAADEERLKVLSAELDGARRAQMDLERLQAAREVVVRRRELAQLQEWLEQQPPWMQHLKGDEGDRLQQWARRLRDLAEEQREALLRLEAAEKALQAAGLPDEGIPLHQLQAWKESLQELRDLEKSMEQAQRDLAVHQDRQAEAAQRLGGAVDPATIAAIEGRNLDALHQLASKHDNLASHIRQIESELRALAPTLEGDAEAGSAPGTQGFAAANHKPEPDPETLRQGIAFLRRWLTAEAVPQVAGFPLFRWGGFVVAGYLFVMGAYRLAIGQPSLAVAFLLPALAAGALAFVFGRRWGGGAGSQDVYQAEYESLNLDQRPKEWTPEAVTALLQDLMGQLQEAEARISARQRQEHLKRQLGILQAGMEEMVEQRRQLAAEMGLPADAGVRELPWLLERLKEWQDADRSIKDLVIRLDHDQREQQRLLAQFREQWAPFGFTTLDDAATVAGALAELEQRAQQWQQAGRDKEEAQRDAARASEAIHRLEDERRALFRRLEMDPDDGSFEELLHQSLEGLTQYQEQQRRAYAAQTALADAEATAQELQCDEAVLALPLPELDARLAVAREQAGRYEELFAKAKEIEAKVKAAKAGTSLQDALARYDDAHEALRSLFQETVRRRLGKLLADHVHGVTRDQERPAVFHRARELFAAITKGRYRLELDEEDGEPVFRAEDRTTGEIRSLDELSDGTRLQLLLAVRVAFAESQEDGLRLPLILDEVLANSDDERAGALIDAVLTLARDGRQIFYFTAQADEVAKWQAAFAAVNGAAGEAAAAAGAAAALDGSAAIPLTFKIIDLARVRAGASAAARPLPDFSALMEDRPVLDEVPAPGDMDYLAYGRLLQVPAIDPFAPVESVHLWHLLSDAEDLYLLLKMGVQTWGPLQTLASTGAAARWEPRLREAFARAAAGAQVVEALLSAWCIGRGLPVDRDVLVASQAVSDTFIDRVTDLAGRLGGDAKALLAALADKQVPRFKTAAREKLARYLAENGYLDERDPLSQEEVRAHALAAAQPGLTARHLTPALVERMLAAVTHGRPGSA